MKDSVSVIICFNTCYMQKNALKDKSNIWSICFSEYAAKFTKKMTKHFYSIICLQQMLCKYKA